MNMMTAMLAGAAIDREDGDSGVKGALIGAAVKLVLPAVLLVGFGFAVRHFALNGLDRVSGTGEAA